MKLQAVLKQIEEKNVAPYILVAGTDGYLCRTAMKAVIAALDVQMPELNLSVFEERPDMGAVAVAMQTLPFMGARRVVLVKNTDMLTTGCPSDYSAPLMEVQMPEGNVLLIVMPGKPDKRKALYKHIQKNGVIIECDADENITGSLVRDAQARGLILSTRNAQHLAEVCGGDTESTFRELEKLAAVCVGDITKADIDKYATRSLQYNVFKLHDFFLAGSLDQAEKLLAGLLRDDPSPIGIISLVAGQFRQMLIARTCRDARLSEGKTIQHITAETGAKEWTARRAMTNCRKYPADKIRQGLEKLSQIDFDAKQGNVELKTDFFALLAGIYL